MADIFFGAIFLFIGVAACTIAGLRRRSGTRIFAWLGIWSALYGASQLSQSQAFVAALPLSLRISAPYARDVITFLAVFPSAFSFRELSLGKLRSLLQIFIFVELAIGAAGSALFLIAGSSARLMSYDQLFRAGMLVVLTIVVALPRLSSRYLVLPDRSVLAIGTLVFTMEALYNSLSQTIGYGTARILDDLGFAFLLFSLAYVALQLVLAKRASVVLGRKGALGRPRDPETDPPVQRSRAQKRPHQHRIPSDDGCGGRLLRVPSCRSGPGGVF